MSSMRLKLTGKYANDKFTLVDDADYVWLSAFKWWYDPTTGYAKTTIQKNQHKQTLKLHRLLFPKRAGLETDHINRDKLDNRRCNLRYVTKGENMRNLLRKDCKSGYRGVSRGRSKINPWLARIKVNGVYKHLGSFPTPEAAALAYNAYASR